MAGSEPLGHNALAPMAVGAIYAFLNGDTLTLHQIETELEDSGVSRSQMMDTFAVMAAAMLSDAFGGQVKASAFSARWFRKITTREARRTARIAG